MEICSLTPAGGASPGQELTYTFKWPEQKNQSYKLTIKSVDVGSSYLTQESITIDNNGFFEKKFSAPSTLGKYAVYLGRSPVSGDCLQSFQVFSPSGALCPPFDSHFPSNPTTTDNVILKFQAPFTNPMFFFIDGARKVNVSSGQQEINIGSGYPRGPHNVQIIGDVIGGTPPRCTAVNFCIETCLTSTPTPTTPLPTPIPPPPPCAEGELVNGVCKKVPTAIGNIPTNPEGLVNFLLKFILGISGGIAILLIIYGGYRLMTSQGNPEAIQGAKETITSAVVGLLFIIFSLVLLQIIGVDILRIPGFGK